MKKFIFYSITLVLCLIGTFVKAQNRVVQGVVRDAQGPVPSVSVVEKGVPTNGVATDLDGKFRITLRSNSGVLLVRAVGYVSKEVNAGGGIINITIESATQDLKEVAVVGYQTVPKKTLTGAQSAVSGNDIRENPSASLQNTLSGRVTGFISQQTSGQPGRDGAAFYVRGQSSLNGNDAPLIIVDDIEYDYAQFARIDPNEVESVTVLKDASQTAIYGIKGANGVVVVTTRRGKLGKPRISFRADYGLASPTILPTYLDSYHTALLVNQANVNDGQTPTWSAADLALFQNGQDPYGHPNNDWKKILFKKYADQYRGTFDVQGGTDKVKYFVSLSYLNQGGNTRDFSHGQGYDGNFYNHRYNYRSNIDITASKNLSFRIDAYGNIGEINNPSVYYNSTNGNKNDVFSEFGSYLALSPYAYPITNPDGSWGFSNFQKSQTAYNTPNIIERLTLDGYNRTNENNMVLSTSATEKLDFITKGLSARGTVAYTSNYTSSLSLTRTNLPSYIYNPTANTYTLAFPGVYRLERLGTNYQPNQPAGPNLGPISRLTAQSFLTYNRGFGNHHISALALYGITSYTTGIANTNVNYANYNYIPSNTIGSSGNVTYDYKQKYILTFTGAYNGSDRFTGNKRYGLFPSGSAAYNIAEEPFFKNDIKFIDQLKFRGSYGIVGSDQISSTQSYSYLQSYINSSGPYTNVNINGQPTGAAFGLTNGSTLPANNGIQEGSLPNANVTWEKSKQVDIGVDFAMFGSKVTGLVDVFNYNRYDQLITRGTVSGIFGQSLPPVNLGRTNAKGFEAELNYHNTIGKNFTYNFRGTYSTAKNKVVFRDDPAAQYPWQVYTGHPIGAEARYHFLGFYTAADIADPKVAKPATGTAAKPGDLKYQDLNGDGVIDSKDQAVSDITNLPRNNFGFQAGFGFKGFTINALFQGATGFNIRGYEEAIRAFSANLQPIHQEAWTPALGDNAKYPFLTNTRSISDPGNASDFWSISGNYLRLRTAELAYNFPARLIQRAGLGAVRVYLSGNNIITWSKAFRLYALDPEATNNTDRQTYPPQKIYNLGVSVTFN